MPVILGSGEHRYRVVENWAKLPEGWNLTDVAAVAVDSRARIEPLVDATARITGTGLVTLERARLLRGDAATGEVEPVTLLDEVHEETKLTIYLGRQERVYRMPAFMAVCDLLHRRGIAGATALTGIVPDSAPHKPLKISG